MIQSMEEEEKYLFPQ